MAKVNFGVYDTRLPYVEPETRFRTDSFPNEQKDSSWTGNNRVYYSIGLMSFKDNIYVIAKEKNTAGIYFFLHEDIVRLQEKQELFDRIAKE